MGLLMDFREKVPMGRWQHGAELSHRQAMLRQSIFNTFNFAFYPCNGQ
jgi:hypothetical protein